MKRKGILLFAFLIALVMALTSCSNSVTKAKSFDVVLNKNYSQTPTTVNSIEQIEELDGYYLFLDKGEFMVFDKTEENGTVTSKVLSGRNKRVVLTVSSSAEEAVEISLYSDIPCFLLSKTRISDGSFSTVRELYDATGALVATASADSVPVSFADMVLFEKVAYRINDSTGALEKIKDIPANLYFDKCDDWNDKYFYVYDKGVNVYDRDFNHVYNFTIPSWAELSSKNMLDNGNVLIQYYRLLDSNANNYDFSESDPNSGEVSKYELYTVLIDPAEKTDKKLDFKYIIDHVSCASELIDKNSDNNMYVDTIENIAYIYPIVDHIVDRADDKYDVVLLSNKGKTVNSLKIVDDQRANIPVLLGDGIYLVSTVYGMALVDIDGNLLRQINNYDIDVTGKNIICDGIIYTFDMDAVYSLSENTADVVTYINDTVFLRKGSDQEYSIVAVSGTEIKDICSYSAADPTSKYFEELSNGSCYSLSNAVEGKYNYYNSEHKLIFESTVRLENLGSFSILDSFVYTASVDGKPVYYLAS